MQFSCVSEGLAAEQPKHLRNLLPLPPLPVPRSHLPSEAIKDLGNSLKMLLLDQKVLDAPMTYPRMAKKSSRLGTVGVSSADTT